MVFLFFRALAGAYWACVRVCAGLGDDTRRPAPVKQKQRQSAFAFDRPSLQQHHYVYE